jgi:hypothetical protein
MTMANANSTNTPTLASVITRAIDSRLRNTGVALPGTVVSYDADSQLATVKPGVHRLVPSREVDGEDVVEVMPAIPGVPVCWLIGRGIQVKASLEAGDTVLLICLDRDADGWLDSGKPSEPGDARNHSWSNAVAIPGLVPTSSPFDAPNDSAALASRLDALITLLASLPVVGTAVAALFPNVSAPTVPILNTTTGSSVLLLDEPLLP